jgi:conjugal transfer pilus assembly protein TraF
MRKRSSNFSISQAIILVAMLGTCSAAPFTTIHDKGWFFYESHPVESVEIESVPKSTNPTTMQTPGEKAQAELEQLQQQLKQASALAILYPTPENVWNYQQLKTRIYDMSGVLTDQEMRNEWTRPDSYAANNPTGGEGLEMNRRELNNCSADLIRKSGDTYGMYLFTSKNCKYCEAQVKVMQQVNRNYNISSMVVGFDGVAPNNIGELPFGNDNGISKNLKVQNDGKPVTVMFNVKTGHSQILGYGYIPLDQINNRICRLYSKKLGDF